MFWIFCWNYSGFEILLKTTIIQKKKTQNVFNLWKETAKLKPPK